MRYTCLLFPLAFLSCSRDNRTNNGDGLAVRPPVVCDGGRMHRCPTRSQLLPQCQRELTFADENTARIMLTDFHIEAGYTVSEHEVILAFGGEGGGTLVFDRLDDGTLRLQDDGTVWKRRRVNRSGTESAPQ